MSIPGISSLSKDLELGDQSLESEDAKLKYALLHVGNPFREFFRYSPLCHLGLWAVFAGYALFFQKGQLEDLSVCGHFMVNPQRINFIFAWLCFSGGELSVRMIWLLTEASISPTTPLRLLLAAISRLLPATRVLASPLRRLVQTSMRALSIVVGLSMIGFVVLPRCLFPPHQHMVEAFMLGGCLLMTAVSVLYSEITRIMLPFFVFFCSVCVYHYHVGGAGFFYGELGFITTYVSFCTVALHPRLVSPDEFSPIWWALACAAPAWLLTTVGHLSIRLCHNPHDILMLRE